MSQWFSQPHPAPSGGSQWRPRRRETPFSAPAHFPWFLCTPTPHHVHGPHREKTPAVTPNTQGVRGTGPRLSPTPRAAPPSPRTQTPGSAGAAAGRAAQPGAAWRSHLCREGTGQQGVKPRPPLALAPQPPRSCHFLESAPHSLGHSYPVVRAAREDTGHLRPLERLIREGSPWVGKMGGGQSGRGLPRGSRAPAHPPPLPGSPLPTPPSN